MNRSKKMIWPVIGYLIMFFILPVSSWAGCGLAFLNGTTPDVTDGSLSSTPNEWADASVVRSGDPCLGWLPDANGTGVEGVTINPPGTHEVVFKTKRDAVNIYIGIEVDDQTGGIDAVSGEAIDLILGERIVIHIDTDNSRDANPKAGDFQLNFTYMRGSAGDDDIEWAEGTGTTWGSSTTPPAGVVIGRANRPAGNPGYIVEIKIPFSAIGYVLDPDPNSIEDIGMAIAVINDMALSNGAGGWYVTGLAFPETEDLHLNNENDVMDSTDVGAPWDSPANWGIAFLTGAGQQIWISREPASWLSEDIKTGFCNSTSFEDTGPRETSNPKWYKYKSEQPCPLRLWGKIRRKGELIGNEERKVLFLWAEHGANPQKWYYVGLVDVLLESGNTFRVTRCIDWNDVPAGKSNHPCVRAFILPKDLNHATVNFNFLQNIGTEAGNNASKISQIRDAYGLATAHEAQMNIHKVDAVTCPPCGECVANRKRPGKSWLQSFSFIKESHARVAKDSDDSGVIIIGPIKNLRDYVVDIQLNGVAPASSGKRYQYVEVMGGLRQVINPSFMHRHRDVKLTFNIANSDDVERRLYLNTILRRPFEGYDMNLRIDQPTAIFGKGESRKIEAVSMVRPPRFKCFPIGGVSTIMLVAGVLVIGFAVIRLKSNDCD